jgi:hypothetical protein
VLSAAAKTEIMGLIATINVNAEHDMNMDTGDDVVAQAAQALELGPGVGVAVSVAQVVSAGARTKAP